VATTSGSVGLRAGVRVAGVEVQPGEKLSTWIELTRVWNGAFNLPLVVAHGRRPGKTLLILGMQHGDEYDGFEAAHRVMDRLDPDAMAGTVICVPCVNVPAFMTGSRRSFMDGLDMNRVHPGKERGFFTEQIVHLLDTKILPLADAVVDLHGGTLDLEVIPYVGLVTSDQASLDLALATGVENLYGIDERRLERTLLVATRELGIPHVNLEAGGGVWHRPEIIDTMVRGMTNVVRHLGIVEGEPEQLPDRVYLRQSLMLGSVTGGLWRSHVRVGTRVAADQPLGVVVDLLNEPLETLRAPVAGFVQDLKTWPKVWPGDWLVLIGTDERVIER
jgi:predicted deacylase